MTPMLKDQLLGLIRHAVTIAGGWIANQGYANDSEADAIAGGVMAVIGVLWSLLDKYKRDKGLSNDQYR